MAEEKWRMRDEWQRNGRGWGSARNAVQARRKVWQDAEQLEGFQVVVGAQAIVNPYQSTEIPAQPRHVVTKYRSEPFLGRSSLLRLQQQSRASANTDHSTENSMPTKLKLSDESDQQGLAGNVSAIGKDIAREVTEIGKESNDVERNLLGSKQKCIPSRIPQPFSRVSAQLRTASSLPLKRSLSADAPYEQAPALDGPPERRFDSTGEVSVDSPRHSPRGKATEKGFVRAVVNLFSKRRQQMPTARPLLKSEPREAGFSRLHSSIETWQQSVMASDAVFEGRFDGCSDYPEWYVTERRGAEVR
jgi:hypothetical protein